MSGLVKAFKGEYRFLDSHIRWPFIEGDVELIQILTGHDLDGNLGNGISRSLADKGDGPGSTGVDLKDVEGVEQDGKIEY